jgi:hypothetical protein
MFFAGIKGKTENNKGGSIDIFLAVQLSQVFLTTSPASYSFDFVR